jgi:hypothetical protein
MSVANLRVYSVMLEGIDGSMGYFMNVEVAANSPTGAAKLAEEYAKERGLTIVGVEEITETERRLSSAPRVLSTSGKSYFPKGN